MRVPATRTTAVIGARGVPALVRSQAPTLPITAVATVCPFGISTMNANVPPALRGNKICSNWNPDRTSTASARAVLPEVGSEQTKSAGAMQQKSIPTSSTAPSRETPSLDGRAAPCRLLLLCATACEMDAAPDGKYTRG